MNLTPEERKRRAKDISERNRKRKGIFKHSEQTKKKMKEAHSHIKHDYSKGKILTEETKIKIGLAGIGRKPWNMGRKCSKEFKNKVRSSMLKVYDRILQEIPELEKQGFRCIPIGKVVPDIIAIKNNKVIAVEVEYGKPNYKKYTDEIRQYYDDINWILRK